MPIIGHSIRELINKMSYRSLSRRASRRGWRDRRGRRIRNRRAYVNGMMRNKHKYRSRRRFRRRW